ncbi:hypothetical protein TD95_002750 [Thielaviopsis punctulata]|uniref:Nucleolar protein 2 n=1 Tax=Thielaviopsis punctulata TaxID=72032 RepID=A0A0F4ZC31_9PEZI|nr:hypothetical protein TD95_002750 [Thielaviopsis punctulata]
MGAGRRMGKKQGMPDALSEEHFARLKRKAGLPVDEVAEDEPEKKRRRGAKRAAAEQKEKEKAAAAAAAASERESRTAKKAREAKAKKAVKDALTEAAFPTPKKAAKPAKKSKKVSLVPSDDEDEDEDDMVDEFDDAEIEAADNNDDDQQDTDDDDDEPLKLRDDFLGSDLEDGADEDNEVYDSDEDQGRGGKLVFSEDEDESDGEERLTSANIEAMSRKLDEERAREEEEADAEMRDMQTNIDGDDRPKVLVDDADDMDLDGEDPLYAKPKALLAPDLQLLRTRMTETIRVLDSFSKLAEPGRSRSEYTAQLVKDICAYYGYSQFLCEKLFALFPPREAFAFFEANETGRPVVIRTNTLRTHRRDLAQALINRGVTLEPVGKWSKVGLQIFESNVPLGATPEYLAGHYILQAASSFLPCVALDPQEGERVLDMAAAPGGKTTYLSALMKNTGFVLANDPNKARAKALIGNVHRLGCRNVVVCNYDARAFPKPIGGFDRVLLDAPCSGTGVISKDPSVKTNKTERDFQTLPHTQKQLLLAAIDSVNHASKTGGFIVYSTCSVTVEENEQVVQYALSRRPNVRLVDTGLTFGKEGFTSIGGKIFDPSLKLTRRYYPHTYNVDGFYVAKFEKFAATPAKAAAARVDALETEVTEDDKAPIVDEDGGFAVQVGKKNEEKEDDGFGGFDEEEDIKIIEKARRNAMRRRGFDPRASLAKKQKGEEKGEKSDEKEKSEKAEKKQEPKKEKKDKTAKGKKENKEKK